jgi:hypothetical protein
MITRRRRSFAPTLPAVERFRSVPTFARASHVRGGDSDQAGRHVANLFVASFALICSGRAMFGPD